VKRRQTCYRRLRSVRATYKMDWLLLSYMLTGSAEVISQTNHLSTYHHMSPVIVDWANSRGFHELDGSEYVFPQDEEDIQLIHQFNHRRWQDLKLLANFKISSLHNHPGNSFEDDMHKTFGFSKTPPRRKTCIVGRRLAASAGDELPHLRLHVVSRVIDHSLMKSDLNFILGGTTNSFKDTDFVGQNFEWPTW
jgi:hypothetical protein